MTGIAGITFINDIILFIKDKWTPHTGGPLPTFSKAHQINSTGHGNSNYDEVIVQLDNEIINIFSLQYSENSLPKWDFLHDVSVTLDVRTGKSEERILEMVNEIIRILKSNITSVINNNVYVRLKLEGATSNNQDFRNMFRYILSFSVEKFNP